MRLWKRLCFLDRKNFDTSLFNFKVYLILRIQGYLILVQLAYDQEIAYTKCPDGTGFMIGELNGVIVARIFTNFFTNFLRIVVVC